MPAFVVLIFCYIFVCATDSWPRFLCGIYIYIHTTSTNSQHDITQHPGVYLINWCYPHTVRGGQCQTQINHFRGHTRLNVTGRFRPDEKKNVICIHFRTLSHPIVLNCIPRNMHIVLLCLVVLWLYHQFQWVHMIHSSIPFRVTSRTLGQS